MKKLIKISVIIVLFFALVVAGGITWYFTSLKGTGSEKIEFIVDKNATFSNLGTTLIEKGLIKSELAYKIYIKLNKPSNLKAGTYTLDGSMNIEKIVEILSKGNSYNPNLINVTFKEGLNIRNIATIISENTNNSYDDVLKMKRIEEMLEVYYNSGQFEITMKVLDKHFNSAFDMFQKLGDFYEAKGYFGMSHSRIRRCEILLEFLEQEWAMDEVHGDWYDCIRQALVFDLYYRENCKSRPSWALPYEQLKPYAYFYCKNGKMSHVEMFSYDFLSGDYAYLDEPVFVLFAYDKRDPLTHQATVQYVNPREDMIIGGAEEPAVIEWQQKEPKKS